MTVVFLVGRGTDKADGASFQIGLQHVRGVHRAFPCCTSTHERVYLVDVDDVLVALLLDTVHNLLDAVFEVATILCTCQQRSDVELVDATALQTLRYASLLNHPCQPPDEGRLSYARLTHVQRVVLVASTEHLYGALQFLLTPNQWIMVLVEVVHAGDQSSPGCLVIVLTRFFFQVILELIATDQLTHEVTLFVA